MKPDKLPRHLRWARPHQELRAALLPGAIGKICHLCGLPMRAGQRLALDHAADGVGYRGMAHERCNNRDGGKRGAALRRRRGGAIPPM